MKAVCAIDSCLGDVYGRGWCSSHYKRWQRHGDPLAGGSFRNVPPAKLSLLDRITRRLEVGDCWTWTGKISAGGYGEIQYKGRFWLVHRAMWTELVGPIADGLTIDHLCRNRACVNPDHLEPVTIRENVLRGDTISAANARKTHCKRGHPFNEENTRWTGKGHQRACRRCHREYMRDWKRRSR